MSPRLSGAPGPSSAETGRRAPPEWAALTDCGRTRENNEDAWGAFALGDTAAPLGAPRPADWPARGILLVLSDGMGGARAGEEASRFCVGRLPVELLAQAGAVGPEAALRAAFLATHAALVAAGRSRAEWLGMGATLSVLWLRADGDALLGHVGDSRLYAGLGGVWRRCTDDHTLGEGLVRRGSMTREAAAHFRFRAMLEQVMGGDGRVIDPQIAAVPWRPGEAFALCSDGLYRPLGGALESRLSAAVAAPRLEDGVRDLVDAANAGGGPDNITVLLARPAAASG